MYKKESLQRVVDCFEIKSTRWVSELADYLWKHRNLIQRYLKYLVAEWVLIKEWTVPSVVYMMKEQTTKPEHLVKDHTIFSYEEIRILNEYFTKFSPSGKRLEGKDWFLERCAARDIDPIRKKDDFIDIVHYLKATKDRCGLLDVSETFHNHIEWWSLDRLYYADQYKWMDFGRGKLAEITYYGKDMEDKKLINEAISLVVNQVECLIHEHVVDAVAFTPHSRKRSRQLLKEFEKKLYTFDLPHLRLVKYAPYGMKVAQKSLKKRSERIQNARDTILLDEKDLSSYKRVLLIDDFVWSGATLNETAKKIKLAWANEVYWFAFVGNANLSYDVIREI